MRSGSFSRLTWFFFFNIVLTILYLLPFHIDFESFVNIHKVTCLNFYRDWLHWICINQVENWHVNNIESFHKPGISIYLDILWLLSLEFYGFSHIDIICILSYLYPSILFLGVNVMMLCFFVSNYNCSLPMYRKAIDFWIVTFYLVPFYNCLSVLGGVFFVSCLGFSHRQSCHLRTKTVCCLSS